jgi:hypothetical protein
MANQGHGEFKKSTSHALIAPSLIVEKSPSSCAKANQINVAMASKKKSKANASKGEA